MKWISPRINQYRVAKKFAWFPKQIDHPDSRVMVWFEHYYALQQYSYNFSAGFDRWNTQTTTQDEELAKHWFSDIVKTR